MSETPANDWLVKQGHNSGGRCEKCWSTAACMYALGQGPYESQTHAYYVAMERAQADAEAAIRTPVADTRESE